MLILFRGRISPSYEVRFTTLKPSGLWRAIWTRLTYFKEFRQAVQLKLP